ncbi:PAS domain-containing sensor histidine kinase [Marinobacter nanhaiticus]|nr:PAS domain-containing sensor histidine kinase [Marinobacter nanhaiticus]
MMSALDAMPGAMVQVDREGYIHDLNEMARHLVDQLQLGDSLPETLDAGAARYLKHLLGNGEHAGNTRELEALIGRRRYRLAVAGRADPADRLVIKLTDITEFRELSERVALSEQRFRSLFYENPDAVFSLDVEGRFIDANRCTLHMVGIATDELKHSHWVDFADPDDQDRIRSSLEAVLCGDSSSIRCRVIHRDGRTVHAYVTHVPILVDGHVVGVFGIARDRTEHYRLEESRRLLSAAMARVQDVILITETGPREDPGPAIVFVNESVESITGYRPDELVGRSARILHGPDTDLARLDRIWAALEERQPVREELVNYRKDGTPFWNEIEIVHIPARTPGEKEYFASVQRDITEAKQRELELRRSREELRRLYKAQDSMLEKERLRIARDLHDELGQTLTALKLDLGVAIADNVELPTGHIRRLQELVRLVDSTIGQVREIASNLRPAMLDDLGFESAAEWFLDRCAGREGIDIRWHKRLVDGSRTTGETATVLYRILQECMTNISRHANAAAVTIDYEETPHRAKLVVEDDGVGFDPGTRNHEGFGLVGMRERVAMLGGGLSVESSPGTGTRVLVTLPLTGYGND